MSLVYFNRVKAFFDTAGLSRSNVLVRVHLFGSQDKFAVRFIVNRVIDGRAFTGRVDNPTPCETWLHPNER